MPTLIPSNVVADAAVEHPVPQANALAVPTHFDFRDRMPALDGLRGLAILSVFLYHYAGGIQQHPTNILLKAMYSVTGLGWAGVDLFFVLSGFLITGILFDTQSDPGYFRKFYARRSLRIFPIYYLFLFVTAIVGTSRWRALDGWPLIVLALRGIPGIAGLAKPHPCQLLHQNHASLVALHGRTVLPRLACADRRARHAASHSPHVLRPDVCCAGAAHCSLGYWLAKSRLGLHIPAVPHGFAGTRRGARDPGSGPTYGPSRQSRTNRAGLRLCGLGGRPHSVAQHRARRSADRNDRFYADSISFRQSAIAGRS